MTPLTRRQRRKIYKTVRRKTLKEYNDIGICHHLLWSLPKKTIEELPDGKNTYEPILLLLPELLSQKPKTVKAGQYWWNPKDKEIRIKALDRCIEETKRKPLIETWITNLMNQIL